jgi:hypothetical protein
MQVKVVERTQEIELQKQVWWLIGIILIIGIIVVFRKINIMING